MGKVIDFFGVRIMICVISIGLGIACITISTVTNIPLLLLSFFLLRFFGQGSMIMVSKTAINYWWIEMRGTVMGIAGSVV